MLCNNGITSFRTTVHKTTGTGGQNNTTRRGCPFLFNELVVLLGDGEEIMKNVALCYNVDEQQVNAIHTHMVVVVWGNHMKGIGGEAKKANMILI